MSAARILIVEDEEKLRRVIQLHLTTAGFDVDTAANAEQALPLVTLADLVITDLRLPGMSGMQLIQEAQSRGSLAAVIVIAIIGISVALAVQLPAIAWIAASSTMAGFREVAESILAAPPSVVSPLMPRLTTRQGSFPVSSFFCKSSGKLCPTSSP